MVKIGGRHVESDGLLNTGRVLDSGTVRVSHRSMVTHEGDRVEWLKSLFSADAGCPFCDVSITSKDDPKNGDAVFSWKVYEWKVKTDD